MYCNRSATPEEAVSFNVDFRVKILKEIEFISHTIIGRKGRDVVFGILFEVINKK
jgi:hypothetical protein